MSCVTIFHFDGHAYVFLLVRIVIFIIWMWQETDFSRSISVARKARNELIASSNSCEAKKGQQVEICFSRRKTTTGFYDILVRSYSLKLPHIFVCYIASNIYKREQWQERTRKKNRLSMLSIEFLWAMKEKISVFTTFMIAKYFYVRAFLSHPIPALFLAIFNG